MRKIAVIAVIAAISLLYFLLEIMGRVLLSGVLMDLREYMSNSAKKQSRGKILLCPSLG